jgi:hypothetical protein
MADCSSIMERNTPNFSRRLVSLAKNPLDRVEPGGGRRGEVKSSAWMAFQPGAHFGMLMRGVVVHDGVDWLARPGTLASTASRKRMNS